MHTNHGCMTSPIFSLHEVNMGLIFYAQKVSRFLTRNLTFSHATDFVPLVPHCPKPSQNLSHRVPERPSK